MLLKYVLVAAVVLAATPSAHAQDAVERQTTEQVEQSQAPEPAPRIAVPRGEAPRSAPEPSRGTRPAPPPPPQRDAAPSPQREPAPPQPAASRAEAPAPDDQRRAEPRGSRPRGDNPPVGTAVLRGTRPAPAPVDRGSVRGVDRNRTVIVRRPPIYNNYYYYPRRSYPYGYGGFGLGYFYYDPYTWYSRGPSAYGSGGFYGGVFRSGRYYGSYFDVGELRLRVSPRHAQVFVDGYYAGIVDDYDGMLQSMKMEDGPYHIEIVAPGYAPLEFDVRILPGQKITYRGDLLPQRP